jgi:lipopolysaccharide export system protein LptA
MIHNANKNKIELFRQAKITQLGNVIRSEYIKYLTDQGLIDSGTSNDRVNITIIPQSKLFDDDTQ